MKSRQPCTFPLLIVCLLLISGCGTFEIGIERTPTRAPVVTVAASVTSSASPALTTPSPSATPTPAPTSSPTSTARPRPTRTATPLPTPTATPVLTITAFTIFPLRVHAGDPVTLTWATNGAESVTLFRTDFMGRLADPGTPVSATGSLVVDMAQVNDQTYGFRLFANRVDETVQALAQAEVLCETKWFFPNPPAACPLPAYAAPMLAERFEHGLMLWSPELTQVSSTQISATGRLIDILYDDDRQPRYETKPDKWSSDLPESDPQIVPPAHVYQPVRGFGLAWRDTLMPEGSRVRNRLGWALAEEFEIPNSAIQCDRTFSTCYITGPDQAIYALALSRSDWSIWTGPPPP